MLGVWGKLCASENDIWVVIECEFVCASQKVLPDGHCAEAVVNGNVGFATGIDSGGGSDGVVCLGIKVAEDVFSEVTILWFINYTENSDDVGVRWVREKGSKVAHVVECALGVDDTIGAVEETDDTLSAAVVPAVL